MKAGVCNLVGNKGAISIEVAILGQQFQFINCHLAAHQKETEQRNATIARILDTLLRKDLRSEVIFLGDFNYRIEMEDAEYGKLIAGRKNSEEEVRYRAFVVREQLTNQPELKRDFLLRFEEGDISFAPTYKIGTSKLIKVLERTNTVPKEFQDGQTGYSIELARE
jgi:endonuclease/exonuclease/phosphatase family metal-dependent hydrolase